MNMIHKLLLALGMHCMAQVYHTTAHMYISCKLMLITSRTKELRYCITVSAQLILNVYTNIYCIRYIIDARLHIHTLHIMPVPWE